jgi:hypothetical protein
MLVFQRWIAGDIAGWDKRPVPPLAARVSAGLSLTLWVGIVVLGRFIGFV